MQIKSILPGCLLILAYFCPHTAHASIIIDSIEPGSPTANDEHITIKNTGPASIDISKWSLQVKNDSATSMQKKNFSPGMRIGPNESFVIANKDGRFALQAQMLYSAISLSGDGGTAALVATTTYILNFDDPLIVTSAHYSAHTTSTPAQMSTPTTALQSVPDTLSTMSSQKIWNILLNELFPNPSHDEEFIEIYNANNTPTDVSGLWLRDASGTSYALGSRKENTLLGPYEFRAWKRSRTLLALNNTDGELVQLVDSNKHIIDEISYSENAMYDTSYAKFNAIWLWTTTPTLSSQNLNTPIPSPPQARAVIPRGPFIVGEFVYLSAEDSTDPDGDITNIIWDFGDGENSHAVTTTHAFKNAGSFLIRLIVEDSRFTTSTVSRTITILPIISELPRTETDHTTPQQPAPEKVHSALLGQGATIIKKQPAKTHAGIVTVPFGYLGSNEIGVDNRTVYIDPHITAATKLLRGSVITFTATEQMRHDRPVLVIGKSDTLQIRSKTDAPEPNRISGVITNVGTDGFDLLSTNATYHVISKIKIINKKRIALGDTIQINGVELHDSETSLLLIPLTTHDIVFAGAEKYSGAEQTKTNNTKLLITITVCFILLHLFLTHYSEQKNKWSIKNLRDFLKARFMNKKNYKSVPE